MQRLREAQRSQIELSSSQSTRSPALHHRRRGQEPLFLDEQLTRAEFQKITLDLLDRTRNPFQSVIKDAGIPVSDIDHVVLVGGSTRMPAVSDLVKEMTGGQEPTRVSTRRGRRGGRCAAGRRAQGRGERRSAA